jgi:hypothetical protein
MYIYKRHTKLLRWPGFKTKIDSKITQIDGVAQVRAPVQQVWSSEFKPQYGKNKTKNHPRTTYIGHIIFQALVGVSYGIELKLWVLVDMWHWTSYLYSLSFSFLLTKIEDDST